jgi:hypothetical protein
MLACKWVQKFGSTGTSGRGPPAPVRKGERCLVARGTHLVFTGPKVVKILTVFALQLREIEDVCSKVPTFEIRFTQALPPRGALLPDCQRSRVPRSPLAL